MPELHADARPRETCAPEPDVRKGQMLPVDARGNKQPLLLPAGPIPVRRLELAWAAGFFDGEGSTFVHGRRRHPKISITQAPDPPNGTPAGVLDRFYRAVGEIGNVEGPYREKTGGLKWLYIANGHEMVPAVIALLWTWLGPVKREQPPTALTQCRTVPRGLTYPRVRFGRPLNTICKRGHDYSDVIIKRDGGRHCRPCRNLLAREHMRRVRADRRAAREAEAPR